MTRNGSTQPRLGVCYYPEHWPEANWQDDAARMVDMGIRTVRIGEFAWSRLEAIPQQLTFDWLERAVDTLHQHGLAVVLGTPTATPPRWMLDKHPDMLAIDEHGVARGFGSRRHYCFSHLPYRDECRRIVTALAQHFGEHPGVTGWQIDNEYGCHDTIPSYSEAARVGFQQWCAQRYRTIEALNAAWGNVFWSMEYTRFDQIGFPVAAVTELNPAHRLAFWRYSSDQVVAFNRAQTDILRQYSPGRDLIHNYMGNFVQFDHHALAKDLDVASWDNYPLGFLTRDGYSPTEQAQYLRTGHPDSSSFHHDLYRGCNNGRWWLMEQQPGPVNWAPYNPAPLDGMVRFWGWEAIAHGAEVVSYFRWRQCPFAQEQMHTGLLRADGSYDVGGAEVAILGEELSRLETLPDSARLFQQTQAPIALLFDYTGIEAQRIQQPGGKTFDPLRYAQHVYGACRQLGLDVDIVASDADLSNYSLIVVTSNTLSDQWLCDRLKTCKATIVLMPRTGSKSVDNSIPDELAPGVFQQLIPIQVARVESLPDFVTLTTDTHLIAQHWREMLMTELKPQSTFSDGVGFHYRHDATGKIVHYLNACLDEPSLKICLAGIAKHAGLALTPLPQGVRTRRTAGAFWVFNFGPEPITLNESDWAATGFSDQTPFLLGTRELRPSELAMWRLQPD